MHRQNGEASAVVIGGVYNCVFHFFPEKKNLQIKSEI